MIRYCLGFAFDIKRDYVLLICKDRPAWQADMWNGLGGKCLIKEDSNVAMCREFKEECGLVTQLNDWRRFCVLNVVHPEPAILYCFSAFLNNITDAHTMESEPVHIFQTHDLPDNLRDNLSWLLPMALAKTTIEASVQEISV